MRGKQLLKLGGNGISCGKFRRQWVGQLDLNWNPEYYVSGKLGLRVLVGPYSIQGHGC